MSETKTFYLSVCFEYTKTGSSISASRYVSTDSTGKELIEFLSCQSDYLFSSALSELCESLKIPDTLQFSDVKVLSRNISRIE